MRATGPAVDGNWGAWSMAHRIILYIDYKSPYAYLAMEPAYQLVDALDVELIWRHYTLDIPAYLDAVDQRSARNWHKVKYAYMDARRIANKRGLTVRGPKKIFDSSIAAIGMLFAQACGAFRPYNDIVFERFWKRELDIEDQDAIAAVLTEAGADGRAFATFLAGAGREAHDRMIQEAEALGVFGVPTFVLDGELFWGGDRIDFLKERLQQTG